MRQIVLAETEAQIARWRAGGPKPTVVSIASACGISRQAFYKSHRVALGKLNDAVSAQDAPSARAADALKLEMLRVRYESEKAKVKVLTTLCGELACELTDVREKLAQERARSDRLKRRTDKGPKLVR
ncbi:hypothetical protein AL480_16665 [Stenotrophomonas maltophilia]|jgi:hypothetical protein|nr:hypothetical protein DP16_3978 [Stenotrophomonas maltophilia]OMP37991.1 hypothetical protein BMR86_20530 [Stenotrophomonas sp. KAs 5-3]RRU25117.1 hypothetical protein EGJ34_01910 [Stenotrophomonas sp. 278]SET73663.1 hypothetical protein SAMN05720615_10760 [Stenotrophomonas indicatrix]AVH92370.1 hypothetical protein AL480_16665 [Stenotrophomonas maltophilia]